MTTMIDSVCAECGVTFQQPYDPGRYREYHSNACRQRAYRRRGGRASGTRGPSAAQRRAEQEAWAKEEARRQRDRERKARARGRSEEQLVTPEWTLPHVGDNRVRKEKRRLCRDLMKVALHPGTPEEGATAERLAERFRKQYQL